MNFEALGRTFFTALGIGLIGVGIYFRTDLPILVVYGFCGSCLIIASFWRFPIKKEKPE